MASKRKNATRRPEVEDTTTSRVLILLEQMQSEDRVTRELVLSLDEKMTRGFQELRAEMVSRFEVVEGVVRGHSTILHSHTATLQEHGNTLREHGDILRGHTVTLQEHGDTLREHGDILRSHTVTLQEHGDILRGHTVTLQEHGDTLREHGDMLRGQGSEMGGLRAEVREQRRVLDETVSATRQNTEEIRRNSEDIRRLSDVVARVERKLDAKADEARVVALEAKVERLMPLLASGT